MTPRITAAVVARVLTQLRHDRRTLAMLLLVPSLVLALLAWMFDERPLVFDHLGAPQTIQWVTGHWVESATTVKATLSEDSSRELSVFGFDDSGVFTFPFRCVTSATN